MNETASDCQQVRILLMALLDGEISLEQEKQVHDHLNKCAACARQYESFVKLKKRTGAMKFKQLSDIYWDDYWNQVYNKIERGISWILISIGAIILLCFAVYDLLENFFYDPSQPVLLKIGTGVMAVGLIVLFVSTLREKIMVRKVDKYRSITR